MPSPTPPPEHLRDEVQSVLIGETEIAVRVRELAADIERDFTGKDLLVVALLTGTVPFLADLIRHIALPMRLDFIGISSYGSGTAPGELVFTKELRLEARDRDVLLVFVESYGRAAFDNSRFAEAQQAFSQALTLAAQFAPGDQRYSHTAHQLAQANTTVTPNAVSTAK